MRKAFTKLMRWGSVPERTGHVDQLTGILRRFTLERQHVPKELAELVALNYLKSIPNPPDGQRYVIDRKRVEVRLE